MATGAQINLIAERIIAHNHRLDKANFERVEALKKVAYLEGQISQLKISLAELEELKEVLEADKN